jgi:hypothetical protein
VIEETTPTALAWLTLCGIEADLERLASLPPHAIDQQQLAGIERQIWQLRQMEKAA